MLSLPRQRPRHGTSDVQTDLNCRLKRHHIHLHLPTPHKITKHWRQYWTRLINIVHILISGSTLQATAQTDHNYYRPKAHNLIRSTSFVLLTGR